MNKIISNNIKTNTRNYLVLCCMLFIQFIFSQTVQTGVDSTKIKIGEEVKLIVNVSIDTSGVVIFPDVKAMGRLEVLESYDVDTTFSEAKMKLIKKYGLTQFDSGTYTIPRQKLLVNGNEIFTDSLSITVQDVEVDTIKQKMFDIKPIVEVQKPKEGLPKWAYFLIVAALIIGAILFWFFNRKQKEQKEAQNKLAPFEEAIENLKALDGSELLENSEYKKYYSQLTDVLKNYFEEEVYENALEQTSDEIITKLKMLKDSGELLLTNESIDELRKVLRTADLVKFAKSKPDVGAAKVDRSTIENIINETKQALPDPTEEDLWRDAQYQEFQRKKERKKNIIFICTAILTGLIISFGVLIWRYGFTEVKDEILGHPTKELLEGDWVRSEYGSPAVVITTPQVLKRQAPEQEMLPEENFAFGRLDTNLFIKLIVTDIPVTPTLPGIGETQTEDEPSINLEEVNEIRLKAIEAQGGKNLLVKQEAYESKDGFSGMKAYGSFQLENEDGYLSKHRYEIITFSQNGAVQQLIMVHLDEDIYGEKILSKITSSVELKKAIKE